MVLSFLHRPPPSDVFPFSSLSSRRPTLHLLLSPIPLRQLKSEYFISTRRCDRMLLLNIREEEVNPNFFPSFFLINQKKRGSFIFFFSSYFFFNTNKMRELDTIKSLADDCGKKWGKKRKGRIDFTREMPFLEYPGCLSYNFCLNFIHKKTGKVKRIESLIC
jgi:hypothetical protein